MKYRAVVIGAGGIAEHHLQAMAGMNSIEPVAIADLREDRAELLARQFGLKAYTDYKWMVLREKPNIAVITLPHYLHKEAAILCAEAGCHIVLEKPMALNTAECAQIISVVKAEKVKLLVGHTQHYIPENRKAKELIGQGSLGRLIMINDTRHVNYFNDERPAWFLEKAKSGGGILMNLGSHSVDKVQWFSDSRIAKVRAVVTRFGARGDVEGSGAVFLQTANGIAATVCQSGYGGVPRNETELIFTGGMMRLVSGQGLWVSENGAYKAVHVEEKIAPFELQFLDLIDCIENGKIPECTMEYSQSLIAAIEGIYRSDEAGEEISL
jgi:predicted dehydrogenase